MCKAISASRHEHLEKHDDGCYFAKLFSMVKNCGSLSLPVALKIRFCDYVHRKNPLENLINSNRDQKQKKVAGIDTDEFFVSDSCTRNSKNNGRTNETYDKGTAFSCATKYPLLHPTLTLQRHVVID